MMAAKVASPMMGHPQMVRALSTPQMYHDDFKAWEESCYEVEDFISVRVLYF